VHCLKHLTGALLGPGAEQCFVGEEIRDAAARRAEVAGAMAGARAPAAQPAPEPQHGKSEVKAEAVGVREGSDAVGL